LSEDVWEQPRNAQAKLTREKVEAFKKCWKENQNDKRTDQKNA
jgi:hypothetical protein